MRKNPAWLEKAVFYQLYPQSFYDSNGDGIGDIPGIISKLDYIAELGVTAVWINPCFISPFQDAGYDVADFYQVAPRYGTNEDLKQLFAEARQRGLRILLDLVAGHTSLQHPWFEQSCQHKPNPYTDWYVWTDSAWKWEVPGYRAVSGHAERDASFITNFFYFQPALNYGFANPDPAHPWQQPVDAPGPQAVRAELRKIMRFWLEQGASGFRVDMAGSLVKGDPGGKATAALWSEMRAWLDAEFPDAVLVAEWSQPSTAVPAGFHVDCCLPFGMPGYISLFRKADGPGPGSDPYGGSYFDKAGRGTLREFLDNYWPHYQASKEFGHIALPSGNHDTGPRLGKGRNTDDLELAFLFLLTMPGTPIIYYGDEIGMPGIDGLPSKEGGYQRTAVRTPMQWGGIPNCGFSSAAPEQLYLPLEPRLERPTVGKQEADTNSLLHRVRKLIGLRKAHPALCASGELEILHVDYPFVFLRKLGKETILVALNPADRPVEAVLPGLKGAGKAQWLYGRADALQPAEGKSWRVQLPGVSASVIKL